MSTQQSYPLNSFDVYLLRSWLVEIAVPWLLYGINAMLLLFLSYILLSQQNHPTKPQLILLILVVFMLILSTACVTLETQFTLEQLPFLSEGLTDAKFDYIVHKSAHIRIALGVLGRTNYIIGDGIVVWRAWIMFPYNQLVKNILILCMLASFVGTFADAGLAAASFQRLQLGSTTNDLIMAIPLLVTNIIATGLNGYKAYLHNKDIREHLSQCDTHVTKAQKILLLLVESGMVYCGIWIATICVLAAANEAKVELTLAYLIFFTSLPFLSALYPILIILLVALERSKEDIRSMNEMSLSQSIRFASAQPAASQSESQREPRLSFNTSISE
ncbi:hypothetical protein D9758_010311 [Tetrapyrgos nigripes]|uniref:Uncharacterized protein n=1 Tax=Tetrapyrgos nigripes TaxID=182062 RepID=A0A8H5LL42_9AGAR|nr:hypothetical protein D9758_010311 [Tetrapyrgos nigripes]